MGEVYGVRSLSTLGTTLIVGDSLGQLPSDWPPPPPGSGRVDRQQLQVANTSPAEVLYQADVGTGFVRRYHLSADGGCVGHMAGDTLFGHSVVTRTSFQKRFPGRVSGTFGTWSWGGGQQRTIGSNP